MRNMINEWCQEINMPIREMTTQEIGQNPFDFAYIIGGEGGRVVVCVNRNFPSRLHFNMQINFAQSQRERTSTMNEGEWDDFLLKITDRLTTYGVDWSFNQEGHQMNVLTMFKFIDESSMDRDRFFQTISRSQVIISQLIRFLNITLGTEQSTTTPTGSDTGSSDTGPAMYG